MPPEFKTTQLYSNNLANNKLCALFSFPKLVNCLNIFNQELNQGHLQISIEVQMFCFICENSDSVGLGQHTRKCTYVLICQKKNKYNFD